MRIDLGSRAVMTGSLTPGRLRHVGSGDDGLVGGLRIVRSYDNCLERWPPPVGSGLRLTGHADVDVNRNGTPMILVGEVEDDAHRCH